MTGPNSSSSQSTSSRRRSRARSPACGDCPIADKCAWRLVGKPALDAVWDEPVQRERALDALVDPLDDGRYALPS
ncbi:hypothetical protein NOGI109294_20125 [Nocardiopsis gilva]